ncbi:hypothetical protein [uncultured Desulfuromonas sp.]|uniref:hypothetical protein n=1 Tax=uncultured Desulfuromonas sp. TaxID=181013 RepID=UPI002AAC0C0B|nr:hypothetical protein [uncultured Desulfuromonas sp.]
MKKLSLRTVVLVVLLLGVVLNVALALRVYQRNRHIDSSTTSRSQQSSEASGSLVKDLNALLSPPTFRHTVYEGIENRNLFSQTRTAWKPPIDEDEEPEETFSKARRTDVVLYGTYLSQGRLRALVEFPHLEEKLRRQRLFAGEQVTSNAKKKKSYTIVSVKDDSITVKDQNAVVFRVGLYDAKKKPHRSAAVAKTSITVEKDDRNEGGSSVVAGKSRAESAAEVVHQRQAKARQEQMIKSGELRKVTTPFGTAYVKSPATKKEEK